MLYFTERGRVLSARNEEIWSWAHLRKVLRIEPADADGELYLLAYEYQDNTLPLYVRLGRTDLELTPNPALQGRYVWRVLSVPASELKTPEVTITISCPAPSMSAWILALDTTGNKGASSKSTDRGRTWRRDGMGYDFILSGEYVVRLWTPGIELKHPDLPFIYEDANHPRLGELLAFLKDKMGTLPCGEDYERALALKDWLAAQWDHQGGPLGSAYAPWEARTIMDWGRRGRGHGLEGLDDFCVHFAAAFVQFAGALGLESRMVFSDVTGPATGDGHCVPEVFCRELHKWVVLDPDVDVVPMVHGRPISAMELHQLGVSDRSGDLELVPGPCYGKRPDPLRDFWKQLWPNALFRRWGFLPRNDFFSHPDAFPCEHGRMNYHCVDMLWYDSGKLPRYRWLPYHSSDVEHFLYHRKP